MVPVQRERDIDARRATDVRRAVAHGLRLAAALALGLSLGAVVASAEDTPGREQAEARSASPPGVGPTSNPRRSPISSRSPRRPGTSIATQIYDGSLAKIKAMIGGDSSPVDVVDLSSSALGALCNDGLLETIEASSLGAAPSGESAEQDFFTGGLSSCGVASVAWSTAIAFDRQAFPRRSPAKSPISSTLKRFPGKRALPNRPRYTLELALLADGVDPANVYTELATPEGVDRAFKALDKIKNDTFWWDNAQEPISWLLEKKAVMAAGYSGRIFRAAVGDSKRFGVIWDGQVYDLDLWAIPKGAKNKDGAKRFIVFASDPARLAAQAELIAYGPMRKSALQLVGKHPVINVEMKDFLPTSPDNFKKALKFDDDMVERARRRTYQALPGMAWTWRRKAARAEA